MTGRQTAKMTLRTEEQKNTCQSSNRNTIRRGTFCFYDSVKMTIKTERVKKLERPFIETIWRILAQPPPGLTLLPFQQFTVKCFDV